MRFYQGNTDYYCGVDLHARNMYLCIVDRQGVVQKHRNLRCNRQEDFLRMLKPFFPNVTVGVECVFTWYWLADLCRDENIPFVLGHALYMRAIHGAKTKNDRVDAEKIAKLTAGGLLPMAYVYPRENRSTRDLLRRRLRFVRQRAELMTHIHHLNTQAQLPGLGHDVKTKSGRNGLATRFEDQAVCLSVESNIEVINGLDLTINKLEKHILTHARDKYQKELAVLRTIPGVGPVIALTMLYEIDTITRFDTRQRFCSYARLVKCAHESDGKKKGYGGKKMGNAYLKWAFSEAAVFITEWSEPVKKYHQTLCRKHGKGKGRSLLAHKLGRAAYHMLIRGEVFDVEKFLNQR